MVLTEKEIERRDIITSEIVGIIKSGKDGEEIKAKLHGYHENDIAQSIELLTKEERLRLFDILGAERVSEVFAYIEEPDEYIDEIGIDKLAAVINEMESDDAAELLEGLDEEYKSELSGKLDEDVRDDIRLINSYEDDEIGSLITNNYVCITDDLTIRKATAEVIRQAGENDNISTIYVVDTEEHFKGALSLKDLIVARENDSLEALIVRSYPYLHDHEKISDSIDKIREYYEDSLPVLDGDGKMIGIITAQDAIDAVDNEMGDDYAKLAGLTSEEDLRETVFTSMKKRLPWLIVLLFLGMAVSTVVGAFEGVVAILPIVICFQSLILDMSGNVGTQSLAVTIRVLMDEDLSTKDRIRLIIKEIKVGFGNGLLLGLLALVFLGLYINLFKDYDMVTSFMISGCVGVSLLVSMIISSLVGTAVPMFFHRIKVDPAVASGPLITTLNDLVAVISYYGLSWLLLIKTVHIV